MRVLPVGAFSALNGLWRLVAGKVDFVDYGRASFAPLKKRVGMTQVGLYIVVICDNNKGRLRITPEKLGKIIAALQDLLSKEEYTSRAASKVKKGRLVKF